MVSFDRHKGSLEIADPIERRRYRLGIDPATDPTPADADRFRFPVDAAVAVDASEITVEGVVHAYVRRADGTMVAELGPGTDAEPGR